MDSTSRKPTRKTAWQRRSDRGPHLATLPSGAVVKFVIPDASTLLKADRLPKELMDVAVLASAHPDGPDGLMADLVFGATASTERNEVLQKTIREGLELRQVLVAEMLVDPRVDPDEVESLPELDVNMLLEFAERRRNLDAKGNQLPILLVREWAPFRPERPGTGGTANGGAAGDDAAGDVPDPDGDAV
jgi:hypothetical protein